MSSDGKYLSAVHDLSLIRLSTRRKDLKLADLRAIRHQMGVKGTQ